MVRACVRNLGTCIHSQLRWILASFGTPTVLNFMLIGTIGIKFALHSHQLLGQQSIAIGYEYRFLKTLVLRSNSLRNYAKIITPSYIISLPQMGQFGVDV